LKPARKWFAFRLISGVILIHNRSVIIMSPMHTQKKYWFPAKKYGWGWGLPTRWQGWAVFVAYAAALLLLHYFFPLDSALNMWLAGAGILTVVLIAICWLTGEPLGARSGR